MKSIIQKSIILFVWCFSLSSIFASDDASRKSFKVAGFQSLNIGNAFEIHIKKSNVYSLTAIGRAEDLQNIEVDLQGNTLEVGIKSNGSWLNWKWNNRNEKIILQISMPILRSAEFSGATKIEVLGFNNEEDCNLSLSGASRINLSDFNADKLSLELSGAAKVKISGQVIKLNYDASGASKLDAFDLFVRDADLELSGASDAMVKVQKSLRVNASGASKVIYKGNPNVSKDVSGASKVLRNE